MAPIAQHGLMARLRRARLPGFVAALAVLLQILLLTDHVAAQASKASLGGFAPGVLRLCVNSPDAGAGGGEAPCPVCVSAACQSALYAPTVSSVPQPAPRFFCAEWRPVVSARPPAYPRVGAARDPPSLSA